MSDNKVDLGHLPGEATPQEVQIPAETPASPPFGLHDRTWSNELWLNFLNSLVDLGIISWKDITALVLGHLNPPQVGTSLASSKGFKRKYGKGNTMKIVREWLYAQAGRCENCGSRLELQADHVNGKENFDDPLDADYIENILLRCRRCNVVRRPSHIFGGITFLTAEAALMWILFVIRPRTYEDFVRLCRLYGMTMADIRMEEAWAIAHWLSRDEPPGYGIEDDENGLYDLILWPDSAITRVNPDAPVPAEARRIYKSVSGSSVLGFLTQREDGKLKFHEQPISFIPFSTYDLADRVPQSLAVVYVPPKRKTGEQPLLVGLAPRGMLLIDLAIRDRGQSFSVEATTKKGIKTVELKEAPPRGVLVKLNPKPTASRLIVTTR